MFKLFKLLKTLNILNPIYYKNPKYCIMKGARVYGRQVMFLGINPIPPKSINDEYKIHGYCDEHSHKKHYISFKNQKYTYSRSNIVCRIWTFKQLLKWRRLLPREGYQVLEFNKKTKEWERIKNILKT